MKWLWNKSIGFKTNHLLHLLSKKNNYLRLFYSNMYTEILKDVCMQIAYDIILIPPKIIKCELRNLLYPKTEKYGVYFSEEQYLDIAK